MIHLRQKFKFKKTIHENKTKITKLTITFSMKAQEIMICKILDIKMKGLVV